VYQVVNGVLYAITTSGIIPVSGYNGPYSFSITQITSGGLIVGVNDWTLEVETIQLALN
jgi:hypothetical protein